MAGGDLQQTCVHPVCTRPVHVLFLSFVMGLFTDSFKSIDSSFFLLNTLLDVPDHVTNFISMVV